MLVIHPNECIDCGVCEPECPVEAIKPDTEDGAEKWLKLNADYAKTWPNITIKRDPPVDSNEWEGKPDKLQYFSPNPGKHASGTRGKEQTRHVLDVELLKPCEACFAEELFRARWPHARAKSRPALRQRLRHAVE